MKSNISETIFVGDSEMAILMRSLDWSKTSLGSPDNWSQSLKTAVRIMITSRQPMFVWWGEQLINLYNDAYRAILGGKHPQALGQPAAIVWEEIWQQVGPRAEQAIQQNQGTYDEALLLIMERNGYPEETYYTFSYSPIPDDDNSTGGIICANSDDTPRIIGERQLALLKELAATTADARTFDAACRLSAECLATNPYDLPLAMIYLVDAQQQSVTLAGSCGIEPGHPAVVKTAPLSDRLWHFAQVCENHQPYLITDLESHFPELPTGAWEKSPHQAVVIPIAPSGRTGQAGILVAALNPYRLFDSNYQRFLDLVAAQIAASIANAQAYEEERKRAEALAAIDQAKTVFFSNVSHEFRTPLTLMLGPLEEMLSTLADSLPPEHYQQLQLVHRNGLRLLKLVNTLLDFSRIEAGRIEAVYEPTDLAMLTADLAGVFRSVIEQAGLQLYVDCPPLPEPIYVDREMWEKIILNLLSNAFKFTFAGEIRVSLRSPNQATSPSHVILEIKDTGTGIPSREIPHIFERFHRVKGARGRSFEGSGIGLSLVQELVRLHGGTIQVSSILDQGTCFTVSIPTGCAHLPSTAINSSRTLASTAMGATPYVEEVSRWLPSAGNGFSPDVTIHPSFAGGVREQCLNGSTSPETSPAYARILLVDDNADMRDYLRRLLSQQYEVEAVGDGMAALSAIRRQIPALVLTDVMMPKLDGFGLLRELRSDPKTKELPIILLSARAGEESRIEGLQAGADDYLIKPFSARELLARVEANLKLAQLRQEISEHKRIEKQLRISQEISLDAFTILESLRDETGAIVDFVWTYVNPKAVEILQHPVTELVGQRLLQVLPGNKLNSELFARYVQVVETGEPHDIEVAYNADGINGWFRNMAVKLEDGVAISFTDITQRKQTEQALVQAEARLNVALQNAPITVFNQDQQLKYTWIHNPVLYDLQEMLGKCDRDFLPPAIAEPLTLLKQGVLDTGVGVRQEVKITKDGITYYYDLTLEPLRAANNAIVGITCAAVDISQLKQAEIDLRESEARFRGVVESNMVGIFFWNESGYITDGNEMAVQMLGYSREELQTGKIQWLDITPLEFHEIDAVMQAQLLTNGVCSPFEKAYIRKDGTHIPVLIGGALLPGYSDRGVAYFIDITERKQSEAALRQALQKLNFHVDNTPMAVIEWDGELRVTRWSQTATKIFGWSADATLGKSLAELNMIFEEDIPQVMQIAGLLMTGEEPYVFSDNRNYTKGGDVIHCEWHNSSLRDASGQLLSVLSLILDVTDKKRAEAEREQLLIQEQAAREAAEVANRIKDEFLAVVSHELRSPLNPILGWAKLLRHRRLDEPTKERALEVIERNAQMQAQLINDLLDVSRILRGKLSLQVSSVDLVSIIQAAMETVRLAAQAKSIDIYTMLDPHVGQVSGDAGRLQQIVWNLLSNAVKFTDTGGRVDIRLERVDSQAQIVVTDTGKGILPEFLPYVFDHFRQESSSTTRRFGGLGLGLAIVRHLVELHGGTVEATSLGGGKGATFRVRLPLMLHQAKTHPDTQPSAPPPNLQGIKILVVDDDDTTREFLLFLLELHHAKVLAVATAKEAIAKFTQFQPDLLLSDIGMPEIDGYMLMQQVRAMPPDQGGNIPAIALTAYAGELDYQQAMSVGFQQHIAKPIEPQVLIQSISTLCHLGEISGNTILDFRF